MEPKLQLLTSGALQRTTQRMQLYRVHWTGLVGRVVLIVGPFKRMGLVISPAISRIQPRLCSMITI
ncbi:hypothetical protein GIB67_039309 [Kingdonia uniflora]|uniref:Uncharacterized protein n=1 Tax=Kingdonia uniflora TaxID=39325 RepID=A0A7J7MMN3_9MAGN|nr:hypothetical protein GIB67_039309 [Kingdonia uniflora]